MQQQQIDNSLLLLLRKEDAAGVGLMIAVLPATSVGLRGRRMESAKANPSIAVAKKDLRMCIDCYSVIISGSPWIFDKPRVTRVHHLKGANVGVKAVAIRPSYLRKRVRLLN